jgi:hypothetical protein
MNPARSFAPALLSRGMVENLWLYWTATFIGTSIIATILGKDLANIALCIYFKKHVIFYQKQHTKQHV